MSSSEINFTILCLLPQVFPGILGESVVGSALQKGLWSYTTVDLRDFGIGKRKKVDAKKYGGGEGMVIRPDVLGRAIDSVNQGQQVYYFSPKGKKIDNDVIKDVLISKNTILVCGKFEGIDDRVLHEYNVKEISLGDFVVSSGEVCAFAFIDACVRMIPGVLGNTKSCVSDSFANIEGIEGILEYPLYTKPRTWRNRDVPSVLLSGHDAKISSWRLEQAIEITLKKRPDLIKKYLNHPHVKQLIETITKRAN